MWFLRKLIFFGIILVVMVTSLPGEVRSTSTSNRLASMASGVLGRWADDPRPAPRPNRPQGQQPEPQILIEPSESRSRLRSHFRENSAPNLSPLTEDELETLLFLLEKVRPQVREQAEGGGAGGVQYQLNPQIVHQRRNKRTGQHGQPHKKSVDWSNYFGIDKRSAPAPPPQSLPVAAASADQKPKVKDQSHNKEHDLNMKSFYKSMAMAGNMKKRKRSVVSAAETNELEEKMKSAGDKLIWDALKLTGSRKDEKLSKEELGALKKKLIEEISTAYNLEKLRQFLKETIGQ